MHFRAYTSISMHMRISIHIMHRVMHRLASKFTKIPFVIHIDTKRIYTICPCFDMQNLIEILLRFYGTSALVPTTIQSVYIHALSGTYAAYTREKQKKATKPPSPSTKSEGFVDGFSTYVAEK